MASIQIRGACPHDCPDNCAWVADVEDGVVTGVHGNPDHPVTAGHLCIKVQKYEERTYHPDRLLMPLLRDGPKGSGSFREATWDEALRVACDGLRAAVERGGPTSVLPFSYMGTAGVLQGGPSMDARFFNALGAAKIDGTICFAAGATAWGMTYGGWPAADIEDAVNARSVVAWGANMVST
ncbi:MAG TPA: molybdopterin-dependent oxidoreductase, partial [Acidimicrobiales bacterium]|nr:molybdopterin-dependent oxidoreductase [Acidimicrobiales bacterium]